MKRLARSHRTASLGSIGDSSLDRVASERAERKRPVRPIPGADQ